MNRNRVGKKGRGGGAKRSKSRAARGDQSTKSTKAVATAHASLEPRKRDDADAAQSRSANPSNEKSGKKRDPSKKPKGTAGDAPGAVLEAAMPDASNDATQESVERAQEQIEQSNLDLDQAPPPREQLWLRDTEKVEIAAMAQAIWECRRRYGISSQEKLAEKLGTSTETVSTWERRKSYPRKFLLDLKAQFPELDEEYDFWLAHYLSLQRSSGLVGEDLDRVLKRPPKAGRGRNTSAPRRAPVSGQDSWIKTNHSTAAIELVPASPEEFAKVRTAVADNYRRHIPNLGSVQRLQNARGDNVFRVVDEDTQQYPSLFLKFYRAARRPEEMRSLAEMLDRIAESRVFPRGKYVTFVRTAADQKCFFSASGDSAPVTATYFLEDLVVGKASHFRGLTTEEVEDVGNKLAQANNVLADSSSIARGFTASALDVDGWHGTISRLGTGTGASPAAKIATPHLLLIHGVLEQIASACDAYKKQARANPVTLTNLHPHHVFTADDECLLICDLEHAGSDWPEFATVAFAAHRFCREFVRRAFEKGKDIQESARNAAYAFLRGYRRSRSLEVVRSVIAEGNRWAKIFNFAKLATCLAAEAGTTRDTDADFLASETRKFISHLLELNELEKLDWWALAREKLLG